MELSKSITTHTKKNDRLMNTLDNGCLRERETSNEDGCAHMATQGKNKTQAKHMKKITIQAE